MNYKKVCLHFGQPVRSVRVVWFIYFPRTVMVRVDFTASAEIIALMFPKFCDSSLWMIPIAQMELWELTLVVTSANKANKHFIGRSR